MKCPLCGYKGDDWDIACAGCPMAKGCGKKRCPNCGYEFVPESSLEKLAKKLIKYWQKLREGRNNGTIN